MKTNSLVHRISKTAPNGEQWDIKIRLDDQCKNGHQDFSITGTAWEKGKPKTDKYMLHGGACGDEIATLWPEFEIFNRLHLCDYKGIPMHCSANMFYFLINGFNKSADIKTKFCEYYRVTPEQFDVLTTSENEIQFALILEKLGIFEQWETEANEAIKLLEQWTGDEFVVDSVRTQYLRPSDEKIAEELEKQKNGYYSEEEKEKRRLAKIQAEFDKLDAEEAKLIEKIKIEYEIKRIMLRFSKRAFEHSIFYYHSNEVCLNWRGDSNQLTPDEIKDIAEKVVLPFGISFKIK